MRIDFEITQAHIDNGVRDNARVCPAALSLQEKVPNADIHVWHDRVAMFSDFSQESVTAKMTKRLLRWIKAYDRGMAVKPAKFRLQFKGWFADWTPAS